MNGILDKSFTQKVSWYSTYDVYYVDAKENSKA